MRSSRCTSATSSGIRITRRNADCSRISPAISYAARWQHRAAFVFGVATLDADGYRIESRRNRSVADPAARAGLRRIGVARCDRTSRQRATGARRGAARRCSGRCSVPRMALQAGSRAHRRRHRWLGRPTHQLLTIDHADYPALLRDIAGCACRAFRRRRCERALAAADRDRRQPQREPCGSGQCAQLRARVRRSRDSRSRAASPKASTRPRTRRRSMRARTTIAVLGTGPDVVYPRAPSRARRAHRDAAARWSANLRRARRDAREFSAPQPDHRRARARHAGRRSGPAFGFADHRARSRSIRAATCSRFRDRSTTRSRAAAIG